MLHYAWEALQNHPFNAITLLLAAGALIVSLSVLGASRRQARASERQADAGEETVRIQAAALKSQADDLRRALELAERTAKAAEASAESTKLLIEVGVRPWINHVEGRAAVEETRERGWHVIADSQIRNGGKTPALELQMTQRLAVVAGQVPDDLDFSTVGGGSVAALAPEREAHIPAEMILSPTEVAAIRRGEMLLCLYGSASYCDVLRKSYKTTWCQTFQIATLSFAYSDKYNSVE